MSYKLFVDDIRDAPDSTWVVVRSVQQARLLIRTHGIPDEMSLDHDMGTNPGGDVSEFVKWLILYDMEFDIIKRPLVYKIHSANPVASENMRSWLDNYMKQKFPNRGKILVVGNVSQAVMTALRQTGMEIVQSDGSAESIRGQQFDIACVDDTEAFLDLYNAQASNNGLNKYGIDKLNCTFQRKGKQK